MSPSVDYQPPTADQMRSRQNEAEALRLLIAQRRLYQRAKRWLGVRWVGMVLIAVGAPLVSVAWPSLAVVAGAIAGLWIFLGRTALLTAQSSRTAQAASVQEQFDFFVFGMPSTGRRSSMPSLEEIAAIVGPDDQIQELARGEALLDWYPFDPGDSGEGAVAIAQRANASYSERLLKSTAITWAVAIGVWVLVLLVISVAMELTLAAFLLGVVLPVLPAFLDVVQYLASVWRSSDVRSDLARTIEDELQSQSVQADDLLVWQERLFELRRSAPEVPDWVYRLNRKVNERSMHTAAQHLSQRAKSAESDKPSANECNDGDDH